MMYIKLENGKYEYHETPFGTQKVLRYGDPWRDVTGDKFIGAMAAEIERLRKELADEDCREQLNATCAELARLRSELARVQKISDNYYALTVEANAREAKLREALRCIDGVHVGVHWRRMIDAALALPADDTALRERLRQERARCAHECEARHANGNYKHDTRHECADALRALGDE